MLIDTCVWLDIAKFAKGEPTLDLLEKYIEEEEVGLILPEIIIAEFKRNKEKIVAESSKSLSSHFKKVKDLVTEHSNPTERDSLLRGLNDIDMKIPTLGENTYRSITRIEKLMKSAHIIKQSDAITLRAANRAIAKKAPFHLDKNSMGDAIIIESYNSYRVQNLAQEFNLYFITHNVWDYSAMKTNRKHFHEDLFDIFSSSKSQYYIDLREALHSVNPELLNNDEADEYFGSELRKYSEIIDIEEELFQKIWYNRHKNREHRINNGEVKIIDSKDFEISTSQHTIVKEIWEGALKSAKKVERLYGKKNLIFDDFEWGMINGKLSALRWVTGDEWDNLDT